MTRRKEETWTYSGAPPGQSPTLATPYTPVHETDPQTIAAARKVLQQCRAMDLAPMLGLESPGPTHVFGGGQ